MKLYTEDEVRRVIKIAFWQDFENGTTEDDIIGFAHSINLPSEEEINKESDERWVPIAFRVAVKWVIEHIKQQVIS
jgi:hypothetical protein